MELEMNKDAKRISKVVLECMTWYTKKNNLHYHSLFDYDGESDIYHIYFCPSKKEIVGGVNDGKKSFFGFMFHIGMFMEICASRKIHVLDSAFSTKTKSLENEALLFTIMYKNKQYAIKIYGKPSKQIDFVTKINIKEKNKGE